jgi:predicted alpha-1,6-mannanase (GH76 family)
MRRWPADPLIHIYGNVSPHMISNYHSLEFGRCYGPHSRQRCSCLQPRARASTSLTQLPCRLRQIQKMRSILSKNGTITELDCIIQLAGTKAPILHSSEAFDLFCILKKLTFPRWNSANALTTLGNFAAVDPTVQTRITLILANSYVAAPKTNLQTTKIVLPDFNIKSFNDSNVPAGVQPSAPAPPKGFINDYYDDEGWWALAWIQAYDITKDNDYLVTAMDIFEDMKNGSTTPCGGIWWDKAHTYVNAIANELYLSVASHLANRAAPANKSYYLNISLAQLAWFQSSSMINAQSTINDGLTTATCKNNQGTVWSYNQGVILGALVELQKASLNNTYLTLANTIAGAAITALSANNILKDSCEPSCGVDGGQFKGIFMRNLMLLQEASPNSKYLAFIKANADSIWANDRDSAGELSVVWAGPFVSPANASTQSSALDALVAATAFAADGIGL